MFSLRGQQNNWSDLGRDHGEYNTDDPHGAGAGISFTSAKRDAGVLPKAGG